MIEYRTRTWISHTNKFIWQRVGKCASCSIKEHLDNHTPDFVPTTKKDNEHFLSYYKFMFVRNPYERLVSAYRNKLEYKKPNPKNPYTGGKGFKQWLEEGISFETFIKRITENEEMLVLNSHWRPYWKYMETFDSTLDFIGKVENFQEDFTTICNKIGIPSKNFPHKNISLKKKGAWEKWKKHPTKFSGGSIVKEYHYSQYYTDELRNLVTQAYARDLKDFNYSYQEK